MSVWTKSDSSDGAPKHPGVAAVGNASGASLFGNTQIAAFNTNVRQAVGIFGVDTTEQRVSESSNTHPQHSGWVVVKQGTGPITSITANASSVATNTFLTFSGGGTGAIQANASVVVNANNYIVRVVLNESNGFIGGSYLVAPSIGQVGNASFTITMGGRAGRRSVETLVATGTIGTAGTADASDDAIFPDA